MGCRVVYVTMAPDRRCKHGFVMAFISAIVSWFVVGAVALGP